MCKTIVYETAFGFRVHVKGARPGRCDRRDNGVCLCGVAGRYTRPYATVATLGVRGVVGGAGGRDGGVGTPPLQLTPFSDRHCAAAAADRVVVDYGDRVPRKTVIFIFDCNILTVECT